MTNRPYGTLYVGVASDFVKRLWEHPEGVVDGFTKRYGLKLMVHAERHDELLQDIQREKSIKPWPRAWKIALIEENNPTWEDLSPMAS